MIEISAKYKAWVVISVIVIPLIFFCADQLLSRQQHQEVMEKLQEMEELWSKSAEDTNFQDYNIYESSSPTATKPPTIIDSSVLIDESSFAIYKTISLSGDGYAVGTKFKPLWNPDGRVHYLLDISNGLENNRVSLFTENNFLKLRIYQEDGTETTIKSRIDDWQNDKWYTTEIKWHNPTGNLFLDVNGANVAKASLGELEMNLDEARLFLGSNMNGGNQADGYFDYIYVRKFVYPEPTVIVGAEESA
ncbi:MAG: hypothetical protein IB616_03445 [Methanosarcinales archaeon]|nr:MAG: hypothetical protein IB616_03445 [Methanosarcinales archaeon]